MVKPFRRYLHVSARQTAQPGSEKMDAAARNLYRIAFDGYSSPEPAIKIIIKKKKRKGFALHLRKVAIFFRLEGKSTK
ncbi:hypothetical protein CEXT_172381 [Caerostris extrusa]|uniref:Uncharacterized protein n=1 Tax=Caerostris extrusa TaxID=172846 RepID=A0AAV4XJ87_CAEEX|nr:hypothetical protein CEXT_172381 [Caerostris extrusa]